MQTRHQKVQLKFDATVLVLTVIGLILSSPGYFGTDLSSKSLWFKIFVLIIAVIIVSISVIIRYLWLVFQDIYGIVIENNTIVHELKRDVGEFNNFTTGFFRHVAPNITNLPSPLNAKLLGNSIVIECRGKIANGALLRLFRKEGGSSVGTFLALTSDGDFFKAIESQIDDPSWAESVKSQDIDLLSYALVPLKFEA